MMTDDATQSLKSEILSKKWFKWSLVSSNETFNDKKWLKILLITSSVTTLTIGGVIIAKRYLRSRKSLSESTVKLNGTIKAQNSEYHDCESPNDNTIIQSQSSPSSSTSTLKGQSSFATITDTGDGNELTKHTKLLPSCVTCSSSGKKRRLSWRSSSSLSKVPLTSGQMISLSMDSLSSSITVCEELRQRIVASGDGPDMIGNKLDAIMEQMKVLSIELERLKNDQLSVTSVPAVQFYDDDDDDNCDVLSRSSTMTTNTLTYWDVEPNLHFFKLFQQALEDVELIPQPRNDRYNEVGCETSEEFRAKVHCIRQAFRVILDDNDNRELFISMGRDILEILLKHSLRDPTECLAAYQSLLTYVNDATNHDQIEREISFRSIPCMTFYDIVLDYIILDSFEDLDNPPSAVSSVANNRWLSAGFRELALQTAVSAVLRHKRSKLLSSDGFFAHFYSILDHVSPILAWGFLGTDQDLKLKCFLVKESLYETIRDYFSFDRVRYTNLDDLCDDILRVTKERYWELNNKLSILIT